MTSPKTLARIAGLLYLILAVCAMFAELYVRSRIVRSGNAAATAENIRSSATLFRVSIVVDLVGATFFLLTAMALYLLLRHVNQPVAAAMVTVVAISVAITGLNLVNQNTALTIATSDDLTRTFGGAESDALTLLFATMQREGGLINTMFFGLWLLPLGYLVIRSGYFPRFLGGWLIAACFGYLALFFAHFLSPGLGRSIAPYIFLIDAGELVFMAWLLIRGVRVAVPQAGPTALTEPASARS
jgi:hypothetical protein